MTRTEPRPGPGAAGSSEPPTGVPAASPTPVRAGVPTPGVRFPWHAAPPPPPTRRAPTGGQSAGFVTRAAANAVDVAVVSLVLALGYGMVAGFRFLLAPTSFRLTPPEFSWVILSIGFGLVAYWTATWAGHGQSHGDQLLGLRVVGPRGTRLHVLHAAVRALLCVVFLPGLFWALVSRHNRSVQDIVVRTRVLYE